MGMKKIRFSHLYLKFKHSCIDAEVPPSSAVLLEVFVADTSKLHDSFIMYDTAYEENGLLQYYELPKGKVIVLLFKSGGLVFTTIRRFSREKYRYYLDSRGEMFEIVVEDDAT